ncbi:carboxypeptidase D-like isoform X2 [Cylas formicarius]|uniref:carboxypeptidase D-like isoform X2 n=1 Tax=Cylas formicarius TaxID=197179 RepID=UPI002958BC75|nr:carboxypeptidase D-like isoform X2 [Cylas formicarius]
MLSVCNWYFVRLCFFIACSNFGIRHAVGLRYHSNVEIEGILKNFTMETQRFPLRSKIYSIGQTLDQNELWVVEITASKKRALGVPNIKFIGNIHGNEAVGREILLQFLYLLRDGYLNKDPTITWLLNNTKIHIMPTMNPDGYNRSVLDCTDDRWRTNGRGLVDLNRSFPDYYHRNNVPQQLETEAVMKWMDETPFILSAALHGGAMVANYPFDTVKETKSIPSKDTVPSVTPDHDVFVHLAKVYSNNHKTMHLGLGCDYSPAFDGGITNGAEWYAVAGGMQDYNYFRHGCMEVTLEISCCKYPAEKYLPDLWDENKSALVKYSLEALNGVTGRILDKFTKKPIGNAVLKISERDITFRSRNHTGEYWRLLLPGKYTLEVQADGYYKNDVNFTIKAPLKFPKLHIQHVYLTNSSYLTTTTSTTTEKISIPEETSFFFYTHGASPLPVLQSRFMADEPEESYESYKGGDASKTPNFCLCYLVFVSLFILGYQINYLI